MLSATAADPHAADFFLSQKHGKPNKRKPVRSRAQRIQQTLHIAHADVHSPEETDERDHQDGDRLTDTEDHLHMLGAPLIEGFIPERLHLGDDGPHLSRAHDLVQDHINLQHVGQSHAVQQELLQ